MTTIAPVARDLDVSEDLLYELTEQMDTEDGIIWVYGLEDDRGLALSDDGIACLRDILAEYRPR